MIIGSGFGSARAYSSWSKSAGVSPSKTSTPTTYAITWKMVRTKRDSRKPQANWHRWFGYRICVSLAWGIQPMGTICLHSARQTKGRRDIAPRGRRSGNSQGRRLRKLPKVNPLRRINPYCSPLLSLKQVATLLGKDSSTIYRALQSGRFPFVTVELGGRTYVPLAEVRRLINGTPSWTEGDEGKSENEKATGEGRCAECGHIEGRAC